MDNGELKLAREILHIKANAQKDIDEALHAHIGEAALSVSAQSIESKESAHEVIEALIRPIVTELPHGNATSKYLFDNPFGDNGFGRLIGQKAFLTFGKNRVVEAKKAQSVVVWLSFSALVSPGDRRETSEPYIPFFMIGATKEKILLAPLEIDQFKHEKPYFLDYDRARREHRKSIRPKKTTDSVFSHRLYASDIFAVKIDPKDHGKIGAHKSYLYSDYTKKEAHDNFNVSEDKIIIDAFSSGSLRLFNAKTTRGGKSKTGPTEIAYESYGEVYELTDEILSRYKVLDHLMDLAVLFGKEEEFDEILHKASEEQT